MKYIELHARSAFSFLEGASVPEELIAACKGLEMPAMRRRLGSKRILGRKLQFKVRV